ncbi:uncharacterized protein LOC134547626 [Prinia subflava]|uniref:uncharacterized protein LOC134547626 n=1 Tax=Prinia subflava TaxID=208062 RepID=UPI002FE32826
MLGDSRAAGFPPCLPPSLLPSLPPHGECSTASLGAPAEQPQPSGLGISRLQWLFDRKFPLTPENESCEYSGGSLAGSQRASVIPDLFLVQHVTQEKSWVCDLSCSASHRRPAKPKRFTGGLRLEGPCGGHLAHLPYSSRASSPGPHPEGFQVSPVREAPQPLLAFCASAWSPSQYKSVSCCSEGTSSVSVCACGLLSLTGHHWEHPGSTSFVSSLQAAHNVLRKEYTQGKKNNEFNSMELLKNKVCWPLPYDNSAVSKASSPGL